MIKIISVNDQMLCRTLEIAEYKHQHYIFLLNFFKNTEGYNNSYWEIWDLLMESEVEYNTLREKIRIKYIIPVIGDIPSVKWRVNSYKSQIELIEEF